MLFKLYIYQEEKEGCISICKMGNQVRRERESKTPVPDLEELFNKPSFPYLNPILGGAGNVPWAAGVGGIVILNTS